MVTKRETEYLKKLREEINSKSLDITKTIQELNYLKQGRLYNIMILFNNKLSEVLHDYYKYDHEFFNESLVSNSIFNYIISKAIAGVVELDKVIVLETKMKKSNAHVINYQKLCDEIFEFDYKKDLKDAFIFHMNELLGESLSRTKLINNKEEYRETIIKDLKTIKLEELTDEIINIFDNKIQEAVTLEYKHIRELKRW